MSWFRLAISGLLRCCLQLCIGALVLCAVERSVWLFGLGKQARRPEFEVDRLFGNSSSSAVYCVKKMPKSLTYLSVSSSIGQWLLSAYRTHFVLQLGL